MARKSPLTRRLLGEEATMTAYPDPQDPADVARSAELAESFGPIELEYAAIRKGCVLLDRPHRGTVVVRGGDRAEFLNRMLTQELKDLAPWSFRPSFWLNRKGRIDADLRVLALPDEIRFDLDVHRAAHTAASLEAFLFSEDVSIRDESESLHRLALHGPAAIMLLASVAEDSGAIESLRPGGACALRIAGCNAIAERDDWLGEIGLELTLGAEDAEAVDSAIAGASDAESREGARLRRAGWFATNIARIEAGTPLYFLDFDETNLPHETGVIGSRINFRKGCYLGQEVVARMEARGQSKQRLVGFRVRGEAGPDAPAVTPETKPVGTVTSSTLSPMLGMTPIGLAMVRSAHATPETDLLIEAEGRLVPAWVRPDLASLPAKAR
jgi:tRNA-modifying protein YgfZ